MNEFTSEKERELRDEVKGKLIEELNLEEITPEDICLLYTSDAADD